MDFYDILELLAVILAGAATAIPLLAKVSRLVQELVQARNWGKALSIIIGLMEDAEELAASGAKKKSWVMQGFHNMAEIVDYDIDDEALSALIDQLAGLTKKVNAPDREGG